MPRNSSGVYTLPAGNPVTPLTVITSAWANPTMSDLGNEITNSLDRSGRGGMLAPFRIFDGTLGQPGLGFLNEVTLGLWREGSSIMHAVNTGVNIASFLSDRLVAPVKLESRGPLTFKVSGVKNWRQQNIAGVLTVNPSTSVDMEDWDLTKGFEADPATGVFNFFQAPTIAGAPIPSGGDLDAIQDELDAHEAATGAAVHGLGTMSTQFADSVAITGGSVTALDRLTPDVPPTLISGVWDWATVPTHSACAPAVTLSFANGTPGEMKRLQVTGAGAITLTGITWATNSPTWGTTGTLVSVVALAGGAYLGITVPY